MIVSDKKDAYNFLLSAMRHLIKSRNVEYSVGPSVSDQHCFVLLWQAQCAIVKNCDIYDQEAFDANLRTSGHACDRENFFQAK
jgi:hypothetical protein